MKHYSHLPTLKADKPSTWKFARRCYLKGLTRGFFNSERQWLGTLYREKILAGATAPVAVEFVSDAIGHGLFAKADLPAYAYVGVYTGILRRLPLLTRSNDYCFSYPTGTWSLRPLTVDAQDFGNEIRFINHGSQPNCEAFGVPVDDTVQVLVRTCRFVSAGDQLTMDYGPHYWKEQPLDN